MKKTVCLCLILILLLGLTGCGKKEQPASPSAVMPLAQPAEPRVEYTCGNYTYILLTDGTAQITAYTGNEKEIILPSVLDGHPVTCLGNEAFYQWDLQTAVTIPDSLVHMVKNPFAGCVRLSEINVSATHPTLEVIDGVLYDKTEKKLICYPYKLPAESYTIPQGTLAIGDGAFSYCILPTVIIPDTVTVIGEEAFSNCHALAAITIPDGVTAIEMATFAYCSALASVILPDTITTIGDGAFRDCKSLATITLPEGIATIGAAAFSGCESLADIVIPNTVTQMGNGVFGHCESLAAIVIPDGITGLGNGMFYGCKALTAVTIPDSVTDIGDRAFFQCPETLTLTVGRDSYAQQYAIDNDLNYTYLDALDWLNN